MKNQNNGGNKNRTYKVSAAKGSSSMCKTPSGPRMKGETCSILKRPMNEKYWNSLAYQSIPAHFGIKEMVDNGISHPKGNQDVHILVSVDDVPGTSLVRITVADWGSGMDIDALDDALRLGSDFSDGDQKKGLCVFGTGLKTFFQVLSRNRYDWLLATKRPDDDLYAIVRGPFSFHMECAFDELPKEVSGIVTRKMWASLKRPSTVASVITDWEMASTAMDSRGTRVSDSDWVIKNLQRSLYEHLGFAYRGYLEREGYDKGPRVKIMIPNFDISRTKDEVLKDVLVKPINPVFEECDFHAGRMSTDDHWTIPVTAQYGVLDVEKTRQQTSDLGFELRHHYLGTADSCGVDIRIGSMTVGTIPTSQIWSKKQAHNSFNTYMAVVHVDTESVGVPKGFFELEFNKSKVKYDSKHWKSLFKYLKDIEGMSPRPINQLKWFMEEKINELRIKGYEVHSNYTVKNTAMKVDVIGIAPDKTCTMYFYRDKKSGPSGSDIANMAMTWNGLVRRHRLQPVAAYFYGMTVNPKVIDVLTDQNESPARQLAGFSGYETFNLHLEKVDMSLVPKRNK